jgi:hypothetical protein
MGEMREAIGHFQEGQTQARAACAMQLDRACTSSTSLVVGLAHSVAPRHRLALRRNSIPRPTLNPKPSETLLPMQLAPFNPGSSGFSDRQ